MRTSVTLLALMACALSAAAAPGDALVANGGFDAGPEPWRNQAAGVDGVTFEWCSDAGRSGGGLHVRSDKVDGIWIWRHVRADAPAGRKVRFEGWIRGRGVQTLAAICLRAQAAGGKLVGFATTQTADALRGDFDWTRVEQTLAVPRDAAELHLLAFVSGAGEAWFDDVAMTDLGPASDAELNAARAAGAGAAGLYRLRGEYGISATLATQDKPTLLMPVPISYREQVPLTYRVDVQPPEKLVSVRLFRDQGDNRVTELVLMPPEPDRPIEARWSAVVLVAPRSFDDVPRSAPLTGSWPEEARPWLRSSRCVQSGAKRIRDVAREIRGDSNDVMAILAATLARTRTIYDAQKGHTASLDALEALDRRGSCTSSANLVAALIRANGIPARILAGYPTWSGPLQTHYIVEAYVPEWGWYPIESTRLEAPWPPGGQVQVSIIVPEYEDRCGMRPAAAAGVPYLSLTEFKHGLGSLVVTGTVDAGRNCDHVAEPFGVLKSGDSDAAAWPRVTAAARARWSKWVDASPTARDGKTIETALTEAALGAASDLAALEKLLAP